MGPIQPGLLSVEVKEGGAKFQTLDVSGVRGRAWHDPVIPLPTIGMLQPAYEKPRRASAGEKASSPAGTPFAPLVQPVVFLESMKAAVLAVAMLSIVLAVSGEI